MGSQVSPWTCRVEPIGMQGPNKCCTAASGRHLLSVFWALSRAGWGEAATGGPPLPPSPSPQVARLRRAALDWHPDVKITSRNIVSSWAGYLRSPSFFHQSPGASVNLPLLRIVPPTALLECSWEAVFSASPPWLPPTSKPRVHRSVYLKMSLCRNRQEVTES